MPSTPLPNPSRDHGGDLDRGMAEFGGTPDQWLDLSTGINPTPYPLPTISAEDWTRLPDRRAENALIAQARRFWNVPDGADILAASGASALIAHMPRLAKTSRVQIIQPTYNEHAAAFSSAGWHISQEPSDAARVYVHPNNPDGRLFSADDIGDGLTVIDESFCDVCPDRSLVAEAMRPGVIILKSFGKFWGLAGLRLGFAIARPETITALREMLGPWPVSGPALKIGTAALADDAWATATRQRLNASRIRMERSLRKAGADIVGGTDLFTLCRVPNATAWQDRLAKAHIWTRIFSYDPTLLRLGLPPEHRFAQLEAAL